MEEITKILMQYKISPSKAIYLSQAILLSIMILLSVLGNLITRKALLKILPHYLEKYKIDWANIMKENKLFKRLSHFVSAIIIYVFALDLPVYKDFLERLSLAYIILVGIFVADSLLNTINQIYRTYSVSNSKPIKGYIQVIKIFAVIVGFVIVVSTILDKSPFIFLSGIGALTAVFLIIFKDSLLGLVAGIQLSSNDMVRLGDWIEMPKYGADGNVIDISLNTVKVQNFDNTITTIPTYALVSDYFKNWRGMQESGGRRIKRCIYIDTSSISFCGPENLKEFRKIQYLSEYLKEKEKEIEDYNKTQNGDPSVLLNLRHMTNIGTFRIYIDNYLKNHPKIRNDMTRTVRQLPSCEFGLPLEIYVFTSETNFVKHEEIQSNIFDHIFSIVPQFGLRVFQQPTGHDMRTSFRI